jgi:hypothetical protein
MTVAWLTMDEVLDYAAVDQATLTRAVTGGQLGVRLLDPWGAEGSLVSRHAVDGWWRERVLSHR